MLMESPIEVHSRINTTELDLFDLPMSYLEGSDIPLPFAKYIHQPDGVNLPYPPITSANTIHLIAWKTIKCRSPSKRELYVLELQKYINVDVYGKCGGKKCGGNGDCWDEIASKYKFYLAFENSICRDYMVEASWALDIGVIPVVLGGGNYSNILPPHSYIDVHEFTSPETLANYRKQVSQNEALYKEYFEWRNHWEKIESGKNAIWCRFCEALHQSQFHRHHHKFSDWFHPSKCTSSIDYYQNHVPPDILSKWSEKPLKNNESYTPL